LGEGREYQSTHTGSASGIRAFCNLDENAPGHPKDSKILRLKAVATDQLSAAFWTIFLIAIKMMLSARRHIAIGTAIPSRQMKRFGIVGDGWKACAIGVFDSSARLTSPDFRIRHFLLTDFTNPHKSSTKTFINLNYSESAIIPSSSENVKEDSFSRTIHSLATFFYFLQHCVIGPFELINSAGSFKDAKRAGS
jgi:hypothetical protein